MEKNENRFVIKGNKKKQSAYLLTCLILFVCLILLIFRDFGLIERMGLEAYVNHRGTIFIKVAMVLLLLATAYFFVAYLILVCNKKSILEIDETGFTHRFNPYEKILWKDVLEISEATKRRRIINVTVDNFDYYLEQLPVISKNFLKRNGKTESQQTIRMRIFTTDYSTKQLVEILNTYYQKYK